MRRATTVSPNEADLDLREMAFRQPISEIFQNPRQTEKLCLLATSDPALKKRLLSALKASSFNAFHSAVKSRHTESVRGFLALTNDNPKLQEKMLSSRLFLAFCSHYSAEDVRNPIEFFSSLSNLLRLDYFERNVPISTLRIITEAAEKYPRLKDRILKFGNFELFEKALSSGDSELATRLLDWAENHPVDSEGRSVKSQIISKQNPLRSIVAVKNSEVIARVFRWFEEDPNLQPNQYLETRRYWEDNDWRTCLYASYLESACRNNNSQFIERFLRLASRFPDEERQFLENTNLLGLYNIERKTIYQIYEAAKKYPEILPQVLNNNSSPLLVAIADENIDAATFISEKLATLPNWEPSRTKEILLRYFSRSYQSIDCQTISLLMASQLAPSVNQGDLIEAQIAAQVARLGLAPAITELQNLTQKILAQTPNANEEDTALAKKQALMAVSTKFLPDARKVAINLLALPEEVYPEYYAAASARFRWETAVARDSTAINFKKDLAEIRQLKSKLVEAKIAAGKTRQESEALATYAAQDLFRDLADPSFIGNQAKKYRRSEVIVAVSDLGKKSPKLPELPLEITRYISQLSSDAKTFDDLISKYVHRRTLAFEKEHHPDSNHALDNARKNIAGRKVEEELEAKQNKVDADLDRQLNDILVEKPSPSVGCFGRNKVAVAPTMSGSYARLDFNSLITPTKEKNVTH
ncbi:MAG: hypothetical protein KA100_01520 [Rickettsiales bacterium]|nr:hypothetical protein [Rickettsiales bacterium]